MPNVSPSSPKKSFAPVVNQDTTILILGSLPGDASLAQQEYYAYPQNRFWDLMSDVIDLDLRSQHYAMRLQTLLEHKIGLWDVVAQAQRRGSLDSQIREREDNDLMSLLAQLPALRGIAFNGATASKIGLKTLGSTREQYTIFQLPSSSPAYTLAYAQKQLAWSALRALLR